jgi:hypothetical protein
LGVGFWFFGSYLVVVSRVGLSAHLLFLWLVFGLRFFYLSILQCSGGDTTKFVMDGWMGDVSYIHTYVRNCLIWVVLVFEIAFDLIALSFQLSFQVGSLSGPEHETHQPCCPIALA